MVSETHRTDFKIHGYVNENAIQPALMLNPCQLIIQSGQYIFHHDFVLKNKITTLHTAFFFRKLGCKFIAGGDHNAKHPWWGSRLANPKGRELYA